MASKLSAVVDFGVAPGMREARASTVRALNIILLVLCGTALGSATISWILTSTELTLLNVIFLAAFTFGCNSWRHLIGGKLDCFSCSSGAKTRHWLWGKFTILNNRHANWAWISLASVWVTDLYIRLAVAGAFTDPHHIF